MTESRGFRAMQIGVALLLLAAAVLKTHQLATEPVMGSGWLDSRWLLIAVVEFEFFFACWLLAGLLPVWTWRATLMLFAAFACVSLYKALSGDASCGCFGRVSVNPWFTFSLDVCVLASLVATGPAVHRCDADGGHLPLSRLILPLGLWLLVGISSGTVMASYQPTTLGDAGELLGDARTVLLEPEHWVGKRFALLDWIEIKSILDEGRWTVVLYRPGCPACEAALRHYQTRTRDMHERVAFIKVSTDDESDGSAQDVGAAVFWGNMPRRFQWIVETPLEVRLIDGKVISCGEPMAPRYSPHGWDIELTKR